MSDTLAGNKLLSMTKSMEDIKVPDEAAAAGHGATCKSDPMGLAGLAKLDAT